VQLEHLRQVIGWRGYAQRDPLNEYKSEAFDLFNNLIGRWHEVTTQQLMRVEISFDAPANGGGGGFDEQAAPADAMSDLGEINSRIAAGEFAPTSLLFGGVGVSAADDVVPEAARDPSDQSTWGKVGRNEPCPCGSGKKFKHCHGALV
jgi:preprotein translocase subunit SecA